MRRGRRRRMRWWSRANKIAPYGCRHVTGIISVPQRVQTAENYGSLLGELTKTDLPK